MEILAGEAPTNAHEVAIDATSAEENDIALGSTIKVLFQGPTQEFTVVGTVGYGDGVKDLGGTTSAYFDTDDRAEGARHAGQVRHHRRERRGRACPRPSSPSGCRPWFPEGTEAVTGKTVADENADAIKENFKIVGIIFGAFAGIALFVGSFIIWNTFTMTVTQRSREIALLRAIGARRRQVMSSLLLEALMLGLAGSAIGLGLGLAVAKGLKALMDAVGLGPAVHLAAGRPQHHLGLDAGRHRRHRRRRPGSGPARHQGAADRGAA